MVNRIVSACVVVAALVFATPAHAWIFPFYEPPDPLGGAADKIVALDFDGNGWPDVAGVSRANGDATLVLNEEVGFEEAQAVAVPGKTGGAVAVAAGDLNGDGREELVAALGDSGSLVVFSGRASGGLGTPVEHVLRPEQLTRWTDVDLADVDGDGDLDVLAAFGTSATVLVNDGRGVLTPSAGAIAIPQAQALTLAKLAGDTDPDLVVLGDSALTVLPGATDAGFGSPVAYPLASSGADLATGDIDGDGLVDVLTSVVFRGKADGGLEPLAGTSAAFDALLLADFDGDGVMDRYTAGYSAAFAHGLPGTFGVHGWAESEGAPHWEQSLAAADFDGDELLDVASAEPSSEGLNVRYFTGPQLVPSDANTEFNGSVGSRSMLAVPVVNEGGGVARGLEAVVDGDDAFEVDLHECQNAVLKVGEQCWMHVFFHPTASGEHTADVGVVAERSGSLWVVTFSGLARAVPPFVPTPTPTPGAGTLLFPRPPRENPPPPVAVMKAVRPGVPAFTRPTLAGLRRSGLRVTQTIGTAETVTWTLEHRGTVLARTQRKSAAGRVTVTLKLTPAGKRLLAKRKPASLTLRTKGTLERVATVKFRRTSVSGR